MSSEALPRRFIEALSAVDGTALEGMYGEECALADFDGAAEGRRRVVDLLTGFRSRYERFELISLDRVQAAGDMLLWDATIETGAGLLQITNMMVLSDAGSVNRHVLLTRGYWGRS